MTILKKRKLEEKISIATKAVSGYSESDVGTESDVSENYDEGDNEQQIVTENKIKSKESLEPKAKKAKNDLLKPPTVEELNQLRETENLFNSNLFRLQIVEMLNEVKIKPKYVKLFQIWYEEFNKTILSLKEKSKQYELSNLAELKFLNINFLMPANKRAAKGSFQFFKPSQIQIVGSYSLGVTLGPKISIDINIEMPTKCFQRMDYLNQRYHQKRALYLCYIAKKLKKSPIVEKIEFANKGNYLKPLLKITPTGKLNKNVAIYIHISCQENSFTLDRFSPNKNNVRQNWFFSNETQGDEVDTPTSVYNFTVLEDLTMMKNEALRSNIFGTHQNLKDGLILLNVWLKQRELDLSCRGFTSYIMSMYMIYLIQQRKLNNAMSSYQIIRNVWNNLAKSNWHDHGITLCTTPPQNSQPTMLEFDSCYDVVFIDSTGYTNICAQMSIDIYFRIRLESERAVKLLDNSKMNSFHALFMEPMPFYRQCDHIIQIKKKVLKKLVQDHAPLKSKLNYIDDHQSQGQDLIMNILRKGLGDRVKFLIPKLDSLHTWDVSEEFKFQGKNVTVGLILNPNEALNILHKGPGANLPEAAEFRKFWGSKSELRRFQDGSISEACVWGKSSDTMSMRRDITRQIVLYLLQNNLSIAPENIKYISGQMENVLRLLSVKPANFEYGTGEEASLKVIQAFDSLSKDLRNLSDLPLEVSSLQGISPVFRYSDVFPGLGLLHKPGSKATNNGPNNIRLQESAFSTMSPVYVAANEAVIQLGLSGKWPENLAALRRLKAAFYIQIANGLTKTYELKTQPNPEYLDVLKDGFVYRLRVAHQKEIGLMKQQVSSEGVTKYRDTEESLEMERNLILMPKLTSALHGLHQQHSAYGPAVCMAKRWLSSQLLDGSHIAPQFVELLVASLFLNSEPFEVPVQPQTAFVRFLNLVGNTDWTITPMIINFNSEMTREQVLEAETFFNANRSTLSSLYLVTPFDAKPNTWSKISPTVQVLVRMALLCRQSLQLIENVYMNAPTIDFKQMFTPSLTGYDLIINLQNMLLPKRFYSLKNYKSVNNECIRTELKELPMYKKLPDEKIPVTAYDPAQCYLKELRNAYDEYALFFHDSYGGDFIAVLWKPQALERKDFKVSHFNGRKIETVDGRPFLRANLAAMIEDFYTIGRGLVRSIENLTNKDTE